MLKRHGMTTISADDKIRLLCHATAMITLRKSDDRGYADHGWLKAKHSFSFAGYYDPEHMGFGPLRVINEDRVAARRGFGKHPHESMEIFTYIISGKLEHKDSMGNGRVIQAGEFQYMSAGSGVTHSEMNVGDEEVHLLQIWIQPREAGGEPRYAEMDTKPMRRENALTLLASPLGEHGSISIRQDAEIYFGHLAAGQSLKPDPSPGYQKHYLQIIHGALQLDGAELSAGDAAMITDEIPQITATAETEFIYFNL